MSGKIDPKGPQRSPLRSAMDMSDDEVLAMFDQQEHGEFHVPDHIIPEGMVYEWKTRTVFGQEQVSELAELHRMGWAYVPAERHPGYFMPAGHKGEIEKKGLVLMELPADRYALRRRYQTLRARQQVQDKEAQLGVAPAGTGPREHSRVRPQVKRGYEPVPVE